MISHAEKRQILDSFIENIACLSDKEYQERVWIRGDGPECDDIDETIADFFDEDYVIKKYKDFGITESQYHSLIQLQNKLREFTDIFCVYAPGKSTEELIAYPQWEEIRDLARVVLKAFNAAA